ncbi:hypothetical protein [Paracidovorax anthurii]|uniref:Uncharacterized protein n=1 Tax=Paracidovorax anthurii TaxID=78229 RepID=A0A328ZQC8_9BURK|nr:hypothetical protein [Paracidovorax anthurii]RAR85027.1 hypothetical protein AX018_1008120 [Paracidovorax anthurii]
MTTQNDSALTDDEYDALPADERSRLRGDGEASPPVQAPARVAADADDGSSSEDGQAEDGKNSPGIPRSRLNEVTQQRREAEQRAQAMEADNARLRAQLAELAAGRAPVAQAPAAPTAPASPAFDVDEAEEQYAQLLMEGDTKAAAAVRRQINQAIEMSAFNRMAQTTASQQSQQVAIQTVDDLLVQHPWLGTEDGQEALDLIEASAFMKVQRGVPLAEALREATQRIAPRFAPPAGGGQGGGQSVDIRVQRAIERGAAHSLMQPANTAAGMGNRATPPNVDTSTLSDDEYMALPEAERRKARGD